MNSTPSNQKYGKNVVSYSVGINKTKGVRNDKSK